MTEQMKEEIKAKLIELGFWKTTEQGRPCNRSSRLANASRATGAVIGR
jgi:hypothetical protein